MKYKNIKSIQLVFNIFRQKPIEKLLKNKKKKIALIARGPLASGLLSGEIDKTTKFPKNDHRNYNKNGQVFDVEGVNLDYGIDAVNELKKILPDNFTLSQLALKWILKSLIPGAINTEQVKINSDVSELDEIDYLNDKIINIYNHYIKKYVHDKWD